MATEPAPDRDEEVRRLREELDALKQAFTSHAAKIMDRVGALERGQGRIRIGDLRA